MRVAFFLLWFGLGRAYRLFFEEQLNRIKTVSLFFVCLISALVFIFLSKDSYNYTIAWIDFKGSNPLWGILMNLIGMLIMLRVCKSLGPLFGNNKLVLCVADNSFGIMANHAFGLFCRYCKSDPCL